MSVYNSSSYLYSKKEETEYASGKGAVELGQTAFEAGDVAELSSMPFPDGEQTFPIIDYEREYLKAASQGADKNFQAIKGFKYRDFSIKQFVQDLTGSESYWMDQAFASLTTGTIPTSYVFHLETADDQFDIMGCVLTEYTLEIAEGSDFIRESMKFMYYSIVDGVAVTNHATTVPFITARLPKNKQDFEISIDGDDMEDHISDCTLTVTINVLDKIPGGKYYRVQPYCLDRTSELKLKFWKDAAAVRRDLSTAEETAKAVVISINGGTDTWTISSMQNDDSNANVVPEFGMKLFDITMKNTGDCSYTRS